MPDIAPRSIRHLGIGPGGERVDNVTDENRHDLHKNNPNLKIHLKTEDLSKVIAVVYIPNTREVPDVVIYDSEIFEVWDTTLKPPVYKQCMVAYATDAPIHKDDKHEQT